MTNHRRLSPRLTLSAALLAAAGPARAEDLAEAWSIALRVNGQLQGQQLRSVAAGLNVESTKRAFLPKVQSQTFNVILNPSPVINPALVYPNAANGGAAGGGVSGGVVPFATGSAAGGSVAAAATSGNAGATGGTGSGGSKKSVVSPVFALGRNQHDIPIEAATVVVPIYKGGQLRANVDDARAQLGAQRQDERRTALDLKLAVAEAYVGVLRAGRALEVAEGDRSRLAAFSNDARNRRAQELATRNDELSARVQLANARQREVSSRRAVEVARSTYNRYLCRPLDAEVRLSDFTEGPPRYDRDHPAPPDEAAKAADDRPAPDEAEAAGLIREAILRRPELASLVAQSQALAAQSRANLANIRPQINLYNGYLLNGVETYQHQNFATTTLSMSWTLTDSGLTRKRTEALRQQERALLRERCDQAAAVALEVRSRWLELDEARRNIPVATEAYLASEENVDVANDRYRQGLATYTQVLDAESQRIQSINSYYGAVYDATLSGFRLRRAVGDL